MYLKILQILLWPRSESLGVRSLHFAPDSINVIFGWSGTGKSAISYIVDYCLGSDKCSIPVGEVRKHVSWYGLLLDLGPRRILVARREPQSAAASEDYYVDEGVQVEVPKRVDKNNTLAGFKARMTALAGLSSLHFEAGQEDPGYGGRASFRDMAAFNFLPQHIVANPYTLFFKADTTEHREKLKAVFPLVLGAVDNEYLVAMHEIAILERELRRLTAELERRKKSVDTWKSEALGMHARARELGLILDSPQEPKSLGHCLEDLRAVLRSISANGLPLFITGATEQAVERLAKLREREDELDRSISDARRRLGTLESLRGSLYSYRRSLVQQEERLAGLGWFRSKIGDAASCPLCGSHESRSLGEVERLVEASNDLASQLKALGNSPLNLDKEEVDLKRDLVQLEGKLRAVRRERREADSEAGSPGAGQRTEDVYRFVGRLEQAIKGMEEIGVDGDLSSALQRVRDRISELRPIVNEPERKEREQIALQRLSRLIGDYANSLGLERSKDVVNLSIRDLTLTFQGTASDRRDYLWEIGSGANWMGYHIACFLALHEFLLVERKRSPVPTFMIIDQPSQVYFPSGAFGSVAEAEATKRDADLEAARRIFVTLADGLQRMNSGVQIIITEHADERVWGEVDFVHKVEDWRYGKDFLIPRAWIDHKEPKESA